MKNKDDLYVILVLLGTAIIFIILLPFLLIYLLAGILCKIIMSPFDYIKYKRSHYQKDYPHKYSWWNPFHGDSAFYDEIKKNDLPLEYIKWSEDYKENGYFVYKDILIDFKELFFFDEEKGAWFMRHAYDDCPDGEQEERDDCETEEKILNVEEAKEYMLENFHKNVPARECKRVAVFYCRKHVKEYGKKIGIKKMRETADFVLYEKKELASAIKNYIETV